MLQGLEWWGDIPQDPSAVKISLVYPAMIDLWKKAWVAESQ